ncbi:MotE family protein [Exiguobacterium oxidotolerans]|uniref:Magnesium transporter MgtE n=1 Tax=Exiguobacterium oxidotolerans TaxID=223958 RepID=A0A653ICI7_9BACL|nr:magnesium transporter MgtE [Exiguobacterium oxidotolerans]VWX36874.1 Magnesium transporter MgtE [Exiguobacterium oxidotolerans]
MLIIPLILILGTAYLVLNYANGRPMLALPFSTEETSKQTKGTPGKETSDLESRLKIANQEIKKLRNEATEQADTLKVKEQEITRLIAERDQLKQTPSPDKTTEEDKKTTKTASVTDVYAEMSPKEAATILNELSPTEVVPIIETIDAEQQAAIIAKMDAKKAAALTQLLATK